MDKHLAKESKGIFIQKPVDNMTGSDKIACWLIIPIHDCCGTGTSDKRSFETTGAVSGSHERP